MTPDLFVVKYVLGSTTLVGILYLGWWFYLKHYRRNRLHKEARWTIEGDRRD